ncbi:MAG: rRNA cytosine-C5-methyltransferase [Bacteroidales bacterium]|nr:rRNA cytosine-C5-methyltransferase [Bacteroidales bacterium]MDY6001259.1 rRNA cytosine-C5-methyltransferase [Candidatus Cryptobacteroides sp.]
MLELGDSRFLNILDRAVGHENAAMAARAFEESASVSVRVNPSKVSSAFTEAHFGKGIAQVPWCQFGYFLEERPRFTLDPLFHAGCYYVQDSSAMYVGSIFRNILNKEYGLGRPFRVLDLCAAPGGKTTDLAASLRLKFGDGFMLVANEVMRGRASILAENVTLWGDANVVVTSADPKAFAKMEGFFDVILADVPCSGEGMFRKDPKALEDWSEDLVALCASRQRRILGDVWPALRAGGFLIYSTCTFEAAENEENVDWIAAELGAEIMECEIFDGIFRTSNGGAMLMPGLVKGEGQFAAVLHKTSVSRAWNCKGPHSYDPMFWIPESIRKDAGSLAWLRPLRIGIPLGARKGNDFVPSADLALAADESIMQNIHNFKYFRAEVDEGMALQFLHRDNIFIEGYPKGYLLICFQGHPMGFVKNLGNRWNSLLPHGRRIRMGIEKTES